VKLAFLSIVLNEEEFLLKCWNQHKDWPGLERWVFVHGACRTYGRANPEMVTEDGCSVDETHNLLVKHIHRQNKVGREVIRFGWADHLNPAQEKCVLRDAAMRAIDDLKPDYFVVIDADEFYTVEDQLLINELLEQEQCCTSLCLPQRHIWCPPKMQEVQKTALELGGCFVNKFKYEVVGAYASVPHCRIYRWFPGLEYRNNHNEPEKQISLHSVMCYHPRGPCCVHLGFARSARTRTATNRYYVERGEGKEDGKKDINRQRYVDFRAAWESWKPGDTLPHGARVVPFDGQVPEVWR
jgi:hypothetical protein